MARLCRLAPPGSAYRRKCPADLPIRAPKAAGTATRSAWEGTETVYFPYCDLGPEVLGAIEEAVPDWPATPGPTAGS